MSGGGGDRTRVTGRMGYNQHLVRSIFAIRDQGGVALAERRPRHARSDPGRPQRREDARLAKAHGIERWTTDLDAALADQDDTVFFDAGPRRCAPTLLRKAIAAGKHIYCEKPIADDLDDALELCASLARRRASSTASCRTSSSCPAC